MCNWDEEQRMQGQLNDPCTVARRHRGWMVEINAGIHPWRQGEGGKERGGGRGYERESLDKSVCVWGGGGSCDRGIGGHGR